MLRQSAAGASAMGQKQTHAPSGTLDAWHRGPSLAVKALVEARWTGTISFSILILISDSYSYSI
jgi:hypothetical protein